MTFTTLTFLIFFPVVFGLYWSIPSRAGQNFLIVVASYFFYGWWDYRFCILMLFTTFADFGVALALAREEIKSRRRFWLLLSLISNLGMLAFFKYFNFFTENFAEAAALLGWRVHPLTLHILLPVGISFYTFHTLGYVIDVYYRRIPPSRSIVDFMAYVAFFPQLVAGPIERARNMLPQFLQPRVFDPEEARDGCRQILWGFFKKMALADNLGVITDRYYISVSSSSGPELMFATFCFAFQIYCDFSAYSDIALGTSRLLGIRLMRNFAYPYFSQSVAEFWRRWHISLSTWFRDYLFIPMGGSRVRGLALARNIMTTFTVSGFWHGASWNFLIWGSVNGLGILPSVLREDKTARKVSDTPGGENFIPSPRALGRMLFTFIFICVTWVFFRAKTLPDAFLILQKIVTEIASVPAWRGLYLEMHRDKAGLAALALLFCAVALEWINRRHPHPLILPSLPRPARWLAYTALVWISLFMSFTGGGQFIYFQF